MKNKKLAQRPRGFIFPVLVFTMSAVMIATLSMMAILVIKIKAYSGSSMCGMRAYYAAQTGLNQLAKSGQLGTYASACPAGHYVTSSGSCALPGVTSTINAIDSDCSYSVQVATSSAGVMQVNAIGRCHQGTDCGNGNGATIKISTALNYPVGGTPFGSCGGSLSTLTIGAEVYDTVWIDSDDSGTVDTGECWSDRNINNDIANNWPTGEGAPDYEYTGRLYDFATADSICPSGWHLSTAADWSAMIAKLGATAGTQLKPAGSDAFSLYWWDSTGYVGDGTANFNIPGSGYFQFGQQQFMTNAYFWTSDDISGDKVVYQAFHNESFISSSTLATADRYLSVRCVNDNGN